VREDNVIRLKITRAEATALRGFARQLTRIFIDAPDEAFDERGDDGEELRRQVQQGTAQDRSADPLAGLVGEVQDVEPDGADGDVLGHDDIVSKLRARGKFRSNRCYLYFEVNRRQRTVEIQISWLPGIPPVKEALGPLGFDRQPRGNWSVTVPIDDFVGVARRVTRALELILTEALQLIKSDDQ
jgi:hypothetical protein